MKNNILKSLGLWLIPATFFGLVYFIRIMPSIFMDEVMSAYDLNYSRFSLLTAAYYAGYAFCQVPVSFFLTKYRANIVFFTALFIVALALFIFSQINFFYFAVLCTFAIGAGSPIGLLGSMSIIESRFRAKNYALLVGITIAFGLVSGGYTASALSILANILQWQSIYVMTSLLVLTYGIISLFCFKSSAFHEKNSIKINLIVDTLKTPGVLPIILFSSCMTSAMQGFADVWGASFIKEKFSISIWEARKAVSLVFFGMGISSPIVGAIFQSLGKLRLGVMICALLMLIPLTILLILPSLNLAIIKLLLLFIGFGSGFTTLSFTMILKIVDRKMNKISMGLANMCLMLSGFIYHPIIGSLYECFLVSMNKITAYTIALSIIPLAILIGLNGFFFAVREEN